MNTSILPRLRLLGAASILVFAASAAMAQTGPEGASEAPAASKSGDAPAAAPQSSPKAGEKAGSGAKKAKAPAKPAAPSGYATEAEAKSHCHGTVVWVDTDHFNHYAGSREYGKKPGAFKCENG